MTKLKQRLLNLIAATGPMAVDDYMAACLFDPQDGYYTTREPFGRDGDFITAPEISQMFGELVAIWLRTAFEAVGRPLPCTLAEIGPGRGTLMKDLLRTFTRLDAKFSKAADIALIETSPRLTTIQRKTLADCGATPTWHAEIDGLPEQPMLIVGNELFDAVPVRQFVKIGVDWRERAVSVDGTDALSFTASAGAVDPALLPSDAANAPEGSIVELAPARTGLMETIAGRLARCGGAGLFIDYGYAEPAIGDTLQALRKHRHEGVLDNPGEADMTAHVDFSALQAAATAHGLNAPLMTQGQFLLGMGLLERAGQLGADAGDEMRQRLASEVERLAGPDSMGNLFKVLAIMPAGAELPPFESHRLKAH